MLISVLGISAQYHGESLYFLSGDVKEVVVKTDNTLLKRFSKVKFLPDGKVDSKFLTYDSNGYPYGFDFTSKNDWTMVRINYDSGNRPECVEWTDGSDTKRSVISVEYRYEANSSVPSECIIHWGEENLKENTFWQRNFTCRYSDYVFDDYGNWISRKVNQIATERDSKKRDSTAESEYVETRKIKYS